MNKSILLGLVLLFIIPISLAGDFEITAKTFYYNDTITNFSINYNDNIYYSINNKTKLSNYLNSREWIDLSTTDAGNWATIVKSLDYDSINNVVWTGMYSGKFGYYNISSNEWIDLSTTDSGNWVSTSVVWSISYDSTNNRVWTGLGNGKFGYYNIASNTWVDLSTTDSGNWVSNDNVYSVDYDSFNNVVWTGMYAGKFGYYKISSNEWIDLSATDSGNWVGTSTVNLINYDSFNNVVWTGMDAGKFGYYNISFIQKTDNINLNFTINSDNCISRTYTNYNPSISGNLEAVLYCNPSILDIQIKNGLTGSLITENITVEILSDSFINSEITSNGTVYFDNLNANQYTLRFISDNYTTSDYQQLILADTYNTLTAYLFPVADNLVSFTTRNEITGVPIENVIYTISTSVNNSLVFIGSKFTDLAGQVTFTYAGDRIYYFTVSKDGYESKSFQLGPVLNANYNVWLSQLAQYNLSEAYLGINLNYYINSYLSGDGITFLSSRFEENKNNTFKMVIASPTGELVSYGYNLTYKTTTVSGSGVNSYGGNLENILEIENADILDKVTLNYYYTSSLTGYHEFTDEFYISQIPNEGLISNLRNQHYGLGMLERVLIVIIVAGIFGGLIGLFSGMLSGGVSIMFIFGYFLYSGFIEIYFIALPIFLLFMFIIRGGDT